MPRCLPSKPRTARATHLLRATVLATLCVMAAPAAQAVVLGPVMLQSRSGEALNVEIPVRRFKAKELPGLTVRIGDEAAYAEAQLTRPEIASQLTVELVPRGEYLRVRVRSARPVTDARLDLVLVVRWQSGRVVRPFTLLLDGSGPLVVPVSSVVVSQGDTASRIALAHKGDQASLEQMLMAMLQSNPDAFIDGNLNRLRVGAVLELPPREDVAKLDVEQARELIATQEREFRMPRGATAIANGKAQDVAAPPMPATPATPSAKQTPPVTGTPDKPGKPGTPVDRLTLSKPMDAAPTQAREQKLAELAKEDAKRIDELQRNIVQLNQTIAELNRSVEALQRKAAAGGDAQGGGVAAAAPAPSSAPSAESAPASSTDPQVPLIEELLRNPATPWAGAAVMAFLLGVAMLRIRQRGRAELTSDPTSGAQAPSPAAAVAALDRPISIPTTDRVPSSALSPAAPQESPAESAAGLHALSYTTLHTAGQATAQAGPQAALAQGLPASVQGLSLDLDPLPPTDPAPAPSPEPGEAAAGSELDDPLAVKLAVAEEFRSLGSMDAARDLAREVLALADEPLKSRARDLLERLA